MHKYRYPYPVVSVNQHYSKGVGNYIVYNKEHVYARILFTNDQTKWTSTSFSVNGFYRWLYMGGQLHSNVQYQRGRNWCDVIGRLQLGI